ncbi:MAG: sulfurtransferase TusA family protein [Phycisphaerae bacterium]|nr:sulfurtransferase TusA family protein [Phycisphaerae bacterium]MDD5381164.1 sulfurtransferase TusA family protein [Phycisphaerae bacterium]
MADKQLDCKNLRCPMPIVKVSKAMKEINIGQTLYVEATDFAFKADIEAWTQKMGHKIVQFTDGPTKQVVIERCN